MAIKSRESKVSDSSRHDFRAIYSTNKARKEEAIEGFNSGEVNLKRFRNKGKHTNLDVESPKLV